MSLYSSLVLELSPAAYWRLGEASSTCADSTANANTMTPHGTVTYSIAGAISRDQSNGITLDGANANYLDTPGSASTDLDDLFSIVAWIKKAANGSIMSIITGNGSGTGGVLFQTDAANLLTIGKQGVAYITTSSRAISDTNWHFVACTKTGATTKLYIDGDDVTGSLANQTIVSTSALPWTIGRNTGFDGQGWNGSLDEIAIFPSVLTAANMLRLYKYKQNTPSNMGRILAVGNGMGRSESAK